MNHGFLCPSGNSILPSFDVSVISTYFPDFEKRILRF